MRELRLMEPAAHVALLFAILFGLLLLITIAGVLYRVRRPVDSLQIDPRSSRAQFKRDLNAAWIGALIFWLAWISGPVGSTLLAGFFSFFCLREFITLQHTTRSDHRALIAAFYGLTYLIYLLNRFVLRVGSVVQGGNFVFKRDAWVKVGGYDRSIEFFGEDTDVAVRLSRVGGVKWTYALKMKTSGRRLEKEGVFQTAATYTLNFFWVTFRGKPATMEYKDVRKD